MTACVDDGSIQPAGAKSVKNRILVLIPLFACMSSLALAQQGGVREQGDRACGKDAQRLCRNVLNQGDTAVLQCFQSNKNKLSPPCAKFLRDVGQLQ
jgi:hypothetical protein